MPARRQPDGPLRPARSVALPRAGRDLGDVPGRGAAGRLRGRLGAARGRADEPRASGATSCCSSASRRARSPTRCRSPRSPTTPRRGCRPTRASTATARSRRSRCRPTGVPPVTPDAFDPAALGEKPPAPKPLKTLLVTGDSLSTPLDTSLARCAGAGGREGAARAAPRLGHLQELPGRLGPAVRPTRSARTSRTRSSSSSAPTRASRSRSRAAKKVECCGADWAAEYANRVAGDDEHLPRQGRRARLLGQADDAALEGAARTSGASSTRRSTSPPSRGRPRSA